TRAMVARHDGPCLGGARGPAPVRSSRRDRLGTSVASSIGPHPTRNEGAMKTNGALRGLLIISTATGAVGCKSKPAATPAPAPAPRPVAAGPAAPPADEIDAKVLKRFLPVGVTETVPAPDSAKVALGRTLFHDKRLSRTGEIACSTCHTLTRFGIDGQRTS